MKLTGRKALYEGTEEVTFISELYFDKGSFFIACIDKNLHLSYDFIYSFTLIDEIELVKANDTTNTSEEWYPDWSKIKYDHLRMDLDGHWWSFNTDNLYFSEVTFDWRFNRDEKGFDCNKEDSITYKHPDPANAIYTRPLNNV